MRKLIKKNKIQKLVTDIPENIHSEFKSKCAKENLSMKKVLEYLVSEFLNENKELKIPY